ncbi:hypothetical protein [Haloarchaeobius amylolyticus]|uniref:hypothetical protein n=1 Tax=Haloarchaeobius amylolyticus TaxID=1198296 RepID=UPI0022714602|nr:hypothetical protein [Haloarchaeobius amylolyticus]
MTRQTRSRRALVAVLGVVTLASGTALAHGGSLRGQAETLAIPTWLFLLTGGAAVGASFLLATLVTDRRWIATIDDWHRFFGRLPGAVGTYLAPVVGLAGLAVVLGFGFFARSLGVEAPLRNLSILLVWVGWWAGYTMSVYLVGNTWPALNPFRTLARLLPSLGRSYPAGVGAWPAVVGLLALVFVEVVSPLADDPQLLAGVVAAYGLLTLAGAIVFGHETWFERADPVSRVFEAYGRVAPLSRTDDGLRLRLPGMALSDAGEHRGAGEVAFVVALLWGTTYDGFVTTPAWGDIARAAVAAGVPALLVYLLTFLAGFGVFLGAYLLAARLARRTGNTYLTTRELALRFAPPLLAIAAGYHLAHYLGYFVSLSLPLSQALANPFAPPLNPQQFVLPAWVGGLALAFVLLGHLLAIWVAHAAAYDLFPSRLQAVRSQYPFIGVMVLYTMASLWIVAEPNQLPPFL